MEGSELFQELKDQVLAAYAKQYPFFHGNWKSFSSKDIRQLIDLVETTQKERVSEKWVYTHLKPETTGKLPRRDMLDIFSRFAGYTGWDEFCHAHGRETGVRSPVTAPPKNLRRLYIWVFVFIALTAAGITAYFLTDNENPRTFEIKNQYTGKPIPGDDVKVYSVSDSNRTPVKVEGSKVTVSGPRKKLVIESPYYKKQEVTVSEAGSDIFIKPEDYALVLRAFMLSDVKDWETRKEQLDKILSDDLEVIVLLKDGLGAEYLNKKDFSQKLTLPTALTRKMKIIALETDDNKKITFIRIEQL